MEGDNFPPPQWKMQLAQFLGVGKILLIMCILGSINPFTFAGQGTPAWFNWFLENKLYGCMMIFFICNAIESQLISTGAFEISVDNMPVWSKIDSGRIPQPPELFQIIDTHLKMNAGSPPEGLGASADNFKDEL